jgi:hypothetical protein
MNLNSFSVETGGSQQQQDKPAPVVHTTKIQHPPLPQTVSTIEKIVLPMAFSLINGLVRDPQKADEFRGFMEPLRDALNAAYPEE